MTTVMSREPEESFNSTQRTLAEFRSYFDTPLVLPASHGQLRSRPSPPRRFSKMIDLEVALWLFSQ